MSEEFDNISTAQILAAIDGVRKDLDDLKSEMRRDSQELWKAVTNQAASISKLNEEVSLGRGGIRVIVWIGGLILGGGMLITSILNLLKH